LAQHVYSLAPYPYLSYDYVSTVTHYVHHSWIASFLALAHFSLFMVKDYTQTKHVILYHKKLQFYSLLKVFQFDESSTYLNGWFRDYLWFNSTPLIHGYNAFGANDIPFHILNSITTPSKHSVVLKISYTSIFNM
jgi:hypothetical protein